VILQKLPVLRRNIIQWVAIRPSFITGKICPEHTENNFHIIPVQYSTVEVSLQYSYGVDSKTTNNQQLCDESSRVYYAFFDSA